MCNVREFLIKFYRGKAYRKRTILEIFYAFVNDGYFLNIYSVVNEQNKLSTNILWEHMC